MAVKKVGSFNIHETPAINQNEFDIETYLNANWEKTKEAVNNNAEELMQAQKDINTLKEDNKTNKSSIDVLEKSNETRDGKITLNKESIKEIQAENERLRNDIKSIATIGEASGENIHIEDSSDARCEIEIDGNHQQETREGYNLLDFNVAQDSRVTVNEDGTITINGTGGFLIKFKEIEYKKGVTYKAKATLVSGTYTSSDPNHIGIMTPHEDNEWLANNIFKTYTCLEDKVRSDMWVGANCVFNNATFEIYCYEGTEDKPFEQYGASPSPDYPSEIETVGSNINLFDKDNQDMFLNGLIPNNAGEIQVGTTNTSASKYLVTIIVPCLPSSTYIISRYVEGKTFFVYESSKKDLKVGDNVTLLKRNNDTGIINEKITTGANAKYLLVKIYNTYEIEPNTYNNLISSVKVEKGTVATPYSPYGMGSVGINIANKNLLYYTNKNQTIKGIDYTINQDKSIKVKGTATEYSDFYLCGTENQYEDIGLVGTFNISGCNSGNSSKYMLYVVKKDKFGGLEYYQNVAGNTKLIISEGDTLRIFIRVLTGVTVDDVIYPMLRVSTDTDNSYTEAKKQTVIMPIQQEMLDGDYVADVEHHEWRKVVLDGTENWNLQSINSYGIANFNYKTGQSEVEVKFNVLSNYFKAQTTSIAQTTNEGIFMQWATEFFIRIKSNRASTIDEFKTFLKSKYDAGTPIIIYYLLTEPTMLECTEAQSKVLDEIYSKAHTYKNITNISAESSEVNPIVSLKYLKDVETEHNKLQAQINEIKELLSSTETSSLLLDNIQKDLRMEVE